MNLSRGQLLFTYTPKLPQRNRLVPVLVGAGGKGNRKVKKKG